MHDDRTIVEDRIRRVLHERIRPAIYTDAQPCEMAAWQVPDEPVPVTEALAASYEPIKPGQPWGRAWSTMWLRVRGRIPESWATRRVEMLVDLGFNAANPGFQAEGLAYTADGQPIKGIAPRSAYVPLDARLAGQEVTVYVEAAANPYISTSPPTPTPLGDKLTSPPEPCYVLGAARLAVLDRDVQALAADIEALSGLMAELDVRDPRRHQLLRALENCLDHLDVQDIAGSAAAARTHLAQVAASPANPSAHHLHAVGHAHIDSAWLWPLRETVRKCARTFSNVTELMGHHPDFVFACSQAQQLAWVKTHHPRVYERIRAYVARGQFVPVGGMWVEADTNLPGGEALARQLVHGKRFYAEEFGLDTQEVWLPDSFGYTAALPQLIALSGSRWFFTQKLSWNQTNRFPHHTFWWEGIDGTRVFTHFAPVDTYNSDLSARDLAHASRGFAEHGRATRSLVPFGYGDGGGGPTREMLEAAHRAANLEGSPTVELGSPEEFFRAAHEEYPDAPVWAGELYLELHRATYTSQARTKHANRRCEHLLREAELWSAAAAVAGLRDYPYEALDRLWKTVLLHQFHDILPGSAIAWVYRDAEVTYRQAIDELEGIIAAATQALAGSGQTPLTFNAAPTPHEGVPALGAAAGRPQTGTVTTRHLPEGGLELDNGLLGLRIDATGTLVSVHDHDADRELLPPGGRANLLQLHEDLPNNWDAWDVDAFYRHRRRDLLEAQTLEVDDTTAGQASVRVTRTLGASHITQTIRLRAGSRTVECDTDVDWHEAEKFLKLAFPLDVRAEYSSAEIQFGHLRRPAHTNTSWDAAKFETCAHRWVHVGEPHYGVALANDATYGYDLTRQTRPDGGTTTTLRASLLRAPRFPDPHTDQGTHHFRHALVVGAELPDAIRAGYQLNLPPRTLTGGHEVAPLVAVDHPGVLVEAVKLAEDRSGDIIVRLYESLGDRARAHVTTSVPLASAHLTDLLERALPDQPPLGDGRHLTLELRPFQVLTLRLRPATADM